MRIKDSHNENQFRMQSTKIYDTNSEKGQNRYTIKATLPWAAAWHERTCNVVKLKKDRSKTWLVQGCNFGVGGVALLSKDARMTNNHLFLDFDFGPPIISTIHTVTGLGDIQSHDTQPVLVQTNETQNMGKDAVGGTLGSLALSHSKFFKEVVLSYQKVPSRNQFMDISALLTYFFL